MNPMVVVTDFTEFVAWEGWRYVNAVLSLIAVLLLSWGSAVRWREMPPRIRRITPWVIFTYAIISYGSVEVARSEVPVPPGVRVLLTTLNLVGLIIALLVGIKDDRYPHPSEESA